MKSNWPKLFLNAALLLAVSACGGGGGGSASAPPASNTAPVANAGSPVSTTVGTLATLDGTASSDANSDPLTYAWAITTKPNGSASVLSSTTASKPTFTPDIVGHMLQVFL